jgi:RHS repeat-associated protein
VRDIVARSDPTDEASRSTTAYSYNECGHVSHRFEPNGTAIAVSDTDGRFRAVSDQSGVRTEQDYNALGLPLATRRYDGGGNPIGETRRSYDSAGNLLSEARALGLGAFAAPAAAASQTDRYTWTGEESPRRHTDPVGTTTSLRYNSRKQLSGQIVRSADGLQSRGIAYHYDDDGQQVETRVGAFDDADPGVLVELTSYDGLGRVRETVDRRRVVWQHAWSGRDLPTRIRRSDIPYGAAIPVTSRWETTRRYDDRGLPTATFTNNICTTDSVYSDGGRLVRQSSAGHGMTVHIPDAAGQVVYQRSPDGTVTVAGSSEDPHRRWTSTIRPLPQGGTATTTTLVDLDERSLPVAQHRRAGGIVVSDRYEWDADGGLLLGADHFGRGVRYERNWAGWPTRVDDIRDPLSPAVTTLLYDDRGLVTKLVDASGADSLFRWNAFGQLAEKSAPGQPRPIETIGYDSIGRRARHRVGGYDIEFVRDARGDIVREYSSRGVARRVLLSREFDELGQLTRAVKYNPAVAPLASIDASVTSEYTYDLLGREQSESIKVGASQPTTVQSIWRDLGDRWQRQLITNTGLDDSEVVEAYDPAGRLRTCLTRSGASVPHLVRFDWIGEWQTGRVHQQPGRPSPLRETIDLDPYGLPIRRRYTVVDTLGGQPATAAEGLQYCGGTWNAGVCGRPLLDISIVRDPVGRVGVNQMRWGNPRFTNGQLLTDLQPVRWRGYTYGARGTLDQLFEAEFEPPPPPPAPYSATASAVAAAGQQATLWTYDRDPITGSILDLRSTNTRRWSTEEPRRPGYELASVRVGDTERPLTFDDAGRLIKYGDTEYRWHPDGTLAAVVAPGGGEQRYAYTHDGRLAAVWIGLAPAQPALLFAYDGPQIVRAVSGGVPAWDCVWGPRRGSIVEWTDYAGGTGLNLPITNHRGDVVGVWSPTDGLRGTVDITPEGRLTVRDAGGAPLCAEVDGGDVCPMPAGLPFGMAGAWRSDGNGLVWLGHRWYHPELGQFLSRDPAGTFQTGDPYSYAGLDPINNTDPTGLEVEFEFEVIPAMRKSLDWWHRSSSDLGFSVGSFFVDTPTSGNQYIDTLNRVVGGLQATLYSTQIQVLAGFIAVGPELVLGVVDALDHFAQASEDVEAAWDDAPGPMSRTEHVVLAGGHLAVGAGEIANAVLFVVGIRDAWRYRRSLPSFNGGDVKPFGQSAKNFRQTLKKMFGQAQAWGYGKPNRRFAAFFYERGPKTTRVWYQGYEYRNGEFMPTDSRYLGTVPSPNAPTPQTFGNAVEGPIRDLVADRMGTRYAPKSPHANGPDLPNTARPLPQQRAGATSALGAVGSPTSAPKPKDGLAQTHP